MPPSSGVEPPIRSNRVVFPAPLGPMKPTISRSATSKPTSWTARRPPKLRVAPRTSSAVDASMADMPAPLAAASSAWSSACPTACSSPRSPPASRCSDACSCPCSSSSRCSAASLSEWLTASPRNTERSRSWRCIRSAVGPWKRMRPRSMKYAVSASSNATLIDCSTRIIVTPFAAISRTMDSSCSTITGARPSDSSSIISSRGSTRKLIPSASICCWPPDRLAAGSSSRLSSTGNVRMTVANDSASAA